MRHWSVATHHSLYDCFWVCAFSGVECHCVVILWWRAICWLWLRLIFGFLFQCYSFDLANVGFLKLKNFGSAISTPCVFLPLDFLFEYWIEHVTSALLYAMFRLSTRIFYSGAGSSGFVIDCPCDVGCRGLNTCLLYVDPLFEKLVWNDNGFVIWQYGEQLFLCL